MAEIKKLLDDAIETEINNLNSASNKDEKSEVIKNLAALHKLRIEEIKTETEIEEKSERRAMDKAAHDEDATLKAFQLDENTLDRYAKIGIAAAELVLPLMFYGVWMRRGLRFEETGTFTSQTFKNLTYVPDYWYFNGGYPCLCHGGYYNQGQNRGPFCIYYSSASSTNDDIGCRLQERPPKAA